MTMITTRSSLQTPKQTPGWKFNKFVSFETNIFPSDVRETAKIRITNYDLGVSKRENSEGDHHRTEYFEAGDDKDIMKIEEDDASNNRLSTFNSLSSSRKRQEKLKLR